MNRNSALIKLDKNTGETIFSQTFNNGGTDAYEHAVSTPNGIVAVGYKNAQDSNNTFYTEGQGFLSFHDFDGNQINTINLKEGLLSKKIAGIETLKKNLDEQKLNF